MRNAYRIYLALTTLIGIAAFFFLLRDPSMDRNAQLFGYSLSRLGVGLIALLFVFLFASLTFKSFLNERWLNRLHLGLQSWLLQGDRLLVVTLTLSALSLTGFILVVIWMLPSVHEYSWYASVFKSRLEVYELLLVVIDRLLPLLVWATLAVFLALLTLIAVFRKHYLEERFWNWQVISKAALVLTMVILSVIHWSVLAMGVALKRLLPGWYWDVLIRPFNLRQGLFIVVLVLSLILVGWVLRHPRRIALNLFLVIALGYLIQISFGFIEGQGYEYIRRKYVDTGHRSYVNIAIADFKDPLAAVREYEQRYGQKMFPSTKPPGVVLFYIMLENIVNTISPQHSGEGRFLVLTHFMAVVFPLVALLVVAVIYLFTRQLVRVEKAIIPIILFIFIPNIMLIPLYLDQVLYPLLFMLGVLLLWQVLKGRSMLLAFFAGVYIYAAVYFTFAMLPLLPFFILLLFLDFVFNDQHRRIVQPVLLLIMLGIGILTTLIAFRLFLNYDILLRYETANRVVRNFDFVLRTGGKFTEDLTKTAVRPGVMQILRAGMLNNLEFAAAVGFPVFLLFIWSVIRTAANLIRRRGKEVDVALAALFLTYFALNVYGQMQGEAARLWMFWVPMVVIFAGFELYRQFRRKELAVYLVVILQLITIWMTFLFQDFIV